MIGRGKGQGMDGGMGQGSGGLGSGGLGGRLDVFGDHVQSVYSKERDERTAKPRFNLDTVGTR